MKLKQYETILTLGKTIFPGCLFVLSYLCLFFKRFYVVGSNSSQTIFRLLSIDRTAPTELLITEDPYIYTAQEIQAL
jgi:hypothetical protein